MFEKTLTDVVRGIRKTKRDKPKFIQQCIDEIKAEIASADMFVKANALQKLTFFQMMGYSMNWASFATIEVMSSARFCQKRIGYLAASQGFRQDTEVILLTTNLLKKELQGASTGGLQGVYNAGLALNCLSNIVTEDLAKALLPEGLRLTFDKLQKCMEDPNSAVVSCAVNVITELSDKNPKNYLSLAPGFFQLLSRSSNNWMLIKVVKLLGSLVPEEPRLARKLLDPLAEIVKSTQAKSLLYESVYTITLCLPYTRKSDGTMPANVPGIVDLCAETLHDFIQQDDQNLKYLGLVGFGSLMQSHSSVLSDPKYRPLVLSCLSDDDVTIRTRALELCPGISSRKNLKELVEQLLNHVEAATGEYKLDLVVKVIELCTGDKYALLQDFKWYLDVLFRLGHVRGIERHGDLLRSQITDVALRVLPVRPFVVRRSIEFLLEVSSQYGRESHPLQQILPAVVWVLGEYSDCIRQAITMSESDELDLTGSDGIYDCLVQRLMALDDRPLSTEKIFIHAAMKVTAAASSDKMTSENELQNCLVTLEKFLPVYTRSLCSDTAEQAMTALSLIGVLGLTTGSSSVVQMPPPTGDLIGMATTGAEEKENVSFNDKGSMGARVKELSQTLVYLFKPSPMKPCGSKAQRKKHQSFVEATPLVNIDDICGALFAEETKEMNGIKRTTESVSFTQQTVFAPVKQELNQPERVATAPAASPWTSTSTKAPRLRQGDPFYLDQDEAMETTLAKDAATRFGAIQLLDSDESGDERDHRVSKRKKKKTKKHGKAPIGAPATAVLRLDDDDSENADLPGGRDPRPKRKPGREFAGLARVDLTKPPPPIANAEPDLQLPTQYERVNPKSKKVKKQKKHRSKTATTSSHPTVGDLLDLGDEVMAKPTPNVFSSSGPMQPSASNPIDSAFDVFAPSTGSQSQYLPKTTPSSSGYFLKASIKSSSGPRLDSVELFYKMSQDAFGSPSSFVLDLRVENRSQLSFSGMVVALGERVIELGTAGPAGSCTSTSTLHLPSLPKDLKGQLRSANFAASVKLRLPCFLQPDTSLTLDTLASELSGSGWSEASVVVDTKSSHKATDMLRAFLNVASVGPSSGSSVSWAATCAGVPVRFLAKSTETSIHVDIKSRNPEVCKMLVSDLKRVALV